MFFILRKRESENYLHPDAIERAGLAPLPYDDFTDMKAQFGRNVFRLIQDMSCDEILAMDRYDEGDVEHHELKEIAEALLTLAGTSEHGS